MKRILCIVFAMCLISMGACNTINSFNGNDGFESLPNISNETVINEEHINKTEEPKQEDNKTDELIHGITPVEYMNKDNISEYHNLTEDQKIAFEFLITVHKDIIENGPVANKTYSLPKRMAWLDYKTAKNLFETNFTALEYLTLPLYSLESQGTREYVDNIYLHDVDERDEEYHREFLALDTRANDILSEIEHDGTEYGKALAIARWMTDNITYAYDHSSRIEDDLNSSYTALMTGEAICGGYAKAYDFLCKKAGLETIYVMTLHPELPHAWNMIRIDEKWYHVDVTWMDTNENKFWMNFMMPDEVCYSNGHMKPDYFWDQKNNLKIIPVADSFDLYSDYYASVKDVFDYFENIEISDNTECRIVFDSKTQGDSFIKENKSSIFDSRGKKFIINIFRRTDICFIVRFVDVEKYNYF